MNKSKQICPTCRRTAKPKIKIHEYPGLERILVTEQCGYCRHELSQRVSTNEIEKVRKDIISLTNRVELGDVHLVGVLEDRKIRYNKLRQELRK